MIEFIQNAKNVIFVSDLAIHYILLVGVVYSVVFPNKRIWPPPKKRSWQHTVTWLLFCLAFTMNASLIFLDWDSWTLTHPSRFFLGVPIAVIGSLFVSWGIATLGTKNTSGLKGGFIVDGPYRYTRNPQYLGDMMLFAGVILISNSILVLITHTLLILVFALTPLTEEVWLEEQYGEKYRDYKKITTRFL